MSELRRFLEVIALILLKVYLFGKLTGFLMQEGRLPLLLLHPVQLLEVKESSLRLLMMLIIAAIKSCIVWQEC